MLHRTQRYERTLPRHHRNTPWAEDVVLGDKFVGWACIFGFAVMFVLAVLP